MREILFRGKRRDNGEWVEGFIGGLHSYKTDEETGEITRIDSYYLNHQSVDAITVGQYTGLTDCNGKKIFEGDILRCVDELNAIEFYARVEFGNPNAGYDWGWQLVKIKGDEPNLDILLWVEAGIDDYVHCQVIGNIHDNPELLDEVRE